MPFTSLKFPTLPKIPQSASNGQNDHGAYEDFIDQPPWETGDLHDWYPVEPQKRPTGMYAPTPT
jgi:hypothetical protein